MYNSVKKYNKFCILTQIDYTPHELNAFEKSRRKKNTKNTDEKSLNNIQRAKQLVYDYAMINDFKYFFTGTINGNYNRKDYRGVLKKVTQKFRDIRKECNDLEYLIIVELHKDLENYHFHGLLKGNLDKYLYLNNNGYLSLSIYDNFGYNSISLIEDIEKCSAYITKYLNKSFCNRGKGERLFFHSNGLILPKKKGFNGDIHFDNWDYQNEYCKKLKLPLEFFDYIPYN